VPARIKLPGGKPKKFPWRYVGREEEQAKANGKAANGANGKPADAAAGAAAGSNGHAPAPTVADKTTAQ
jgi:hypothetical protein